MNDLEKEYSDNHKHDYEYLKDLAKEYFDCKKEEREDKYKWILNWVRTH